MYNMSDIVGGADAYKGKIQQQATELRGEIDKLSKKSLQRLLRVYSGLRFADELLNENSETLSKSEEQLLLRAIALQDDCVGLAALSKELGTL